MFKAVKIILATFLPKSEGSLVLHLAQYIERLIFRS
jgi:hypothetical protein